MISDKVEKHRLWNVKTKKFVGRTYASLVKAVKKAEEMNFECEAVYTQTYLVNTWMPVSKKWYYQ